ncbi:MAG: metallophosphoesterase [Desulfofustis sp.]|nr:metallophosphoesterase [Desulfofustis sp.]
MKTAILSDVHGNLEALNAVMSDLDEFKPDRTVCLGDLIGYGPDPEAVINIVAAHGISCVLGNHEAALSSEKALGWLNFMARENNLATKALLSDQSLEFCTALPRSISFDESCFVHGCPPDSILKYLYMLRDGDITNMVETLPEKRFFVGHTHDLQLITVSGSKIARAKLTEGISRLDDESRYFINVGSVGHPRDGSSKAKYVIWDSSDGTLMVRAISYPAEVTAEKIISRGFPKAYAICICPSFR